MNWLLAFLTAALLIAIHPGPNVSWLAWLALAPLLSAVAGEPRAKRRFLLGWSAGIVYWFGVCYWIQFVLEVHGGMGRWGGWGTFILFCLAKAIHLGVFSMAAGWLMPHWYGAPAVAALWVGIERTHGTFGFAWLTLGDAGIDMPPLLHLPPITGVYGLSFLFSLTAACCAAFLRNRNPRGLAWLAVLLIPFVLPSPRASAPSESAAVLQPNLDEEQEWTRESIAARERQMVAESLETSVRAHSRLIVWPEAPAPLYYFSDPQFRQYAGDLARTAQAYFLFGTVGFTPEGAPLNSAAMLSPAGDLVDRYDKMYLVPFGEFIPPLFGFVNRITKEAGDFTPGQRVVAFPFGGHKLGAFICYESAFPHLVRRFTTAGADAFVNISNDGYFGASAAREQHLALVRMRAVENRRWILRPTNNGVTAVIDPTGKIRKRLEPFRETADVLQFGYESALTPYSQFGDWFAWSCLVIAGGLTAFSATAARRRASGSPG